MTDRVLAQELARAVEDAEPEQLDLLAEPETEGGRLKVAHLKRGPGRPAGSRNKRVALVAERLVAMYGDPRERCMALIQMNTADLAHWLGCSMLEAVQEQRLAFVAVAPFVVQRQPLSVDITDRKVVYLTISDGQAAASEDSGIGLTARVVERVEYQEVSEPEKAELDSGELDSSR